MSAFGWTIEYTLALSWPVFMDLFPLIRRIRIDAGIDGVFTPYCAGKYGKSFCTDMFKARGGLYINAQAEYQYSDADVSRAKRRLRKILRARENQLAEAAAENNLQK